MTYIGDRKVISAYATQKTTQAAKKALQVFDKAHPDLKAKMLAHVLEGKVLKARLSDYAHKVIAFQKQEREFEHRRALARDKAQKFTEEFMGGASAAHQDALNAELDQLETDEKEHREKASGFSEERSVPVVESWTFKPGERMNATEDTSRTSAAGAVAEGTVYLGNAYTAAGGDGAQFTAGQDIFCWPLSPMTMPTSELSTLALIYDLYQIEELVLEYIPLVGSDTGGAVVGSCDADISQEPDISEAGGALVRDMLARPGAQANQLFTPAAYKVSFSQQEWYFCSNADAPNLAIPAMFKLVTVQAPSPNKSYGMIVAHYKIKFIQASLDRAPLNAIKGPGAGQLILANTVAAAGIYAQAAGFPSSISGLVDGTYVGTCMITETLTPGGSSLDVQSEGKLWTLIAPTRVYYRLAVGGNQVVFYTNMAAAMENNNPQVPPVAGWDGQILAQATNNFMASAYLYVENAYAFPVSPSWT